MGELIIASSDHLLYGCCHTNGDLLSTRPIGRNFSETWIRIFDIRLKSSFATCQPIFNPKWCPILCIRAEEEDIIDAIDDTFKGILWMRRMNSINLVWHNFNRDEDDDDDHRSRHRHHKRYYTG